MLLEKAALHVFSQLEETLVRVSSEDYSRPHGIFQGSTIGQHVRHSVEMFICLNAGYETGEINYESRRRDKTLEESKTEVVQTLTALKRELGKPDKPLLVFYSGEMDEALEACSSGYYRELAYCIEHAVHHMAILKMGLKALYPGLELPEGFGVAASTLKYRKICAL